MYAVVILIKSFFFQISRFCCKKHKKYC